MASTNRMRVAFLAGTLGRGGAEKQLVYMVKALRLQGVEVRVYTLTSGEGHEDDLERLGVKPVWIGRWGNPLVRLVTFVRALRGFRPHVIQAGHFYTNLYVALAAPLLGAVGIGAIRNDAVHNLRANGAWGPWLLRMPRALITNSWGTKRNAVALGASENRIQVVPNALDLQEFDRCAREPTSVQPAPGRILVAAVARHVLQKRLDRFLQTIATVRRRHPQILGMLLGDGPERGSLERTAERLGLVPDGVLFLGSRTDVPAVLRQAQILLVTADHEGFPNAVLEAMAAWLPIVTTPAGEMPHIVSEGVNGYVVDFDDIDAMAARLIHLAEEPALRERMGAAGRRLVEEQYSFDRLAGRLLDAYRILATRAHLPHVAQLVPVP